MRFDSEGRVSITTWAELALLDDATRKEWILENMAEYKRMAAEEMSRKHYPKAVNK
jgi:hypothetical protein